MINKASFPYRIEKFDGSYCKEYSLDEGTETDFKGFQECTRKVVHSIFSGKLNCSISGFVNLAKAKFAKPLCSNHSSAAESYKIMFDFGTQFVQNTEKFGCPKPCNSSSFSVDLNFGHLNSIVDPFSEYDVDINKNYILMFFFQTLDVTEQVETLAYDLSAFLAAAGGNLGLALGFSCLSILLGLLNYLSKLILHYN
jgi:hypothetical protein